MAVVLSVRDSRANSNGKTGVGGAVAWDSAVDLSVGRDLEGLSLRIISNDLDQMPLYVDKQCTNVVRRLTCCVSSSSSSSVMKLFVMATDPTAKTPHEDGKYEESQRSRHRKRG